MKAIIKFFGGLIRENGRRYLLGFQVAAWSLLLAAIFTSYKTAIALSAVAVVYAICYKIWRYHRDGQILFQLVDVGVILAGAANLWIYATLFYLFV